MKIRGGTWTLVLFAEENNGDENKKKKGYDCICKQGEGRKRQLGQDVFFSVCVCSCVSESLE